MFYSHSKEKPEKNVTFNNFRFIIGQLCFPHLQRFCSYNSDITILPGWLY